MAKRILQLMVGLFALIILLFTAVFFAVKWGWTNVPGVVDTRFNLLNLAEQASTTPSWATTEEWQTLKAALVKDQVVIDKVSSETGISNRLIVTMVAPEQLRLYFDEREIFKQIFAPLKILGSQTQFSWGVAGLKQETAKQIENNLTDSHLLDFQTANPDAERFNRLTDQHNHYYSYLYVALFIKEIEAQWRVAGFNISDKPEILATLWNIGFAHSQPNNHPQVGGAEIEINNTPYSFGGLAGEFYYSDELIKEFPH